MLARIQVVLYVLMNVDVAPSLTQMLHMVSPNRKPLQNITKKLHTALVNLKLAQKFYSARLLELRDLIAAEEIKFK